MNILIAQFAGIDNSSALPLAAGVLIASARMHQVIQEQMTFDIVVPRTPLPEIPSIFQDCQLAGFSLYPWNAEYSLAAIKRLASDIPVIVGGPSVPKRKDDVIAFMKAHPNIDFLLLGEGEQTFAAFLLSLIYQNPPSTVSSIAYREEGNIIISSPASRVTDFTQTASPYLDGTFDKLLQRYPNRFQMGMLETNRGCPFRCTFCDWSITRKVLEIPLTRIFQEIDWLIAHQFSHFCLIDANFGIRPRDHQIAQYIAKQKQVSGRPTSCYFYLTKNNHQRNWETIQTFHLAQIDCTVGLAVQDFDDGVLKAVKRGRLQSSETNQLRDQCAKQGIPTRNELILGLPKQSYHSFVQTLLLAMPPYPKHDFILFLCRLLDNTELANPKQRALHALETRRCKWVSPQGQAHGIIDEYQEIIVGTADMPTEKWKETVHFANIASMGYNKYLMRIIFRAVKELWNTSLQEYIEHLINRMKAADSLSTFGQLWTVLNAYTDSILDGNAYQLPYFSEQDRSWELDEALSIVVLLNSEMFFKELYDHSATIIDKSHHAQLHDIVLYQRHCIPSRTSSSHPVHFSWDCLNFQKAQPLLQHPVILQFEQPFYSSLGDDEQFVNMYLNLMQARGSSTQQVITTMATATRISKVTALNEMETL